MQMRVVLRYWRFMMTVKEIKLMQIGPSIRLGGGGSMNCLRLLKHVCLKGQTNYQQYWRFMKKVIAINPYDSQSQVIYDISGIAPALCVGNKRWGGLAPIIMESDNDENAFRERVLVNGFLVRSSNV